MGPSRAAEPTRPSPHRWLGKKGLSLHQGSSTLRPRSESWEEQWHFQLAPCQEKGPWAEASLTTTHPFLWTSLTQSFSVQLCKGTSQGKRNRRAVTQGNAEPTPPLFSPPPLNAQPPGSQTHGEGGSLAIPAMHIISHTYTPTMSTTPSATSGKERRVNSSASSAGEAACSRGCGPGARNGPPRAALLLPRPSERAHTWEPCSRGLCSSVGNLTALPEIQFSLLALIFLRARNLGFQTSSGRKGQVFS